MSATMVPLGDLCEIASGGTPRRSIIKYWENGSIPWLKISDLAGKHISMAEETITYAGLESSSAKLFEPGTILVSIFATIGVAGILDIPATTNQAIAGIKPFDSTTLSPEYLYYWIIAQKDRMEASGRGVAQNNINLSYLRSLQIPLPDMERQRSIIAIFSMFDELFEYSKGRLQKFDDLVKSRFIEMFGDPIENNSKLPKYKWEDVLTIVNGKNQKKVECATGEYPICGSGGEMGRAKQYLTKGDSVIIGRKGNINNPILMREPFWNVDTAFGLEPNADMLIVEYLYYYCEWFDFQKLNKAVTIPSLTKADLLKIEMPLPPLALQQEFADFVSQVDKLRFEAQQQIEKLETLKKSLMQEYFG